MTLHLSGLPGCPTPGPAEEFAVTNELRTRGTDYLLEAAPLAGIRRFIAQSFTIVDDEPAAGSGVGAVPGPLPGCRDAAGDTRLARR